MSVMEHARLSLFIKGLIYVGLAFVLNQTVQFILPVQGIKPDIFFVLSWTFSYFYESRLRLPLTMACGLLRDWLYSPVLGLSLIVCLLTSYLAGHLFQVIWQRKFYYLPVQVSILTVLSRCLEVILLRLNLFFQYKISLGVFGVVRNLGLDLPMLLLMNIMASVIFAFVLTHFYPFSKFEKELYAENLIRP